MLYEVITFSSLNIICPRNQFEQLFFRVREEAYAPAQMEKFGSFVGFFHIPG